MPKDEAAFQESLTLILGRIEGKLDGFTKRMDTFDKRQDDFSVQLLAHQDDSRRRDESAQEHSHARSKDLFDKIAERADEIGEVELEIKGLKEREVRYLVNADFETFRGEYNVFANDTEDELAKRPTLRQMLGWLVGVITTAVIAVQVFFGIKD